VNWPTLKPETNHTDQLGWYKVSHKSGAVYYPCRTCVKDEDLFLFDDSKSKSKSTPMTICLLGWKYKQAGTFEKIHVAKWFPWTKDDEPTNKKRLASFLQAVGVKWDHDPVSNKTEELAIRAMWQRVQERETEGPSEEPTQLVFPTSPNPRIIKEIPNGDGVSSDEEEDDSDVEEEEAGSTYPRPKKKQKLRDGDMIEYYSPIAVCGKSEWLTNATVIGICPRHKTLPLDLDTGDAIDRDHLIRIVKRRLRGKMVDNKPGQSFKALRQYSLVRR
jgi:hypothetical protein